MMTNGSTTIQSTMQASTWSIFDCQEPVNPGANFLKGDIQSREEVTVALNQALPDVIFHLAGIAFVPQAEENKDNALSINLGGGLNLLESVAEILPESRILVISSSEVYGMARPEEMPLSESTPTRPANFYAFTKAALENAASYWASSGLNVKVIRPFNHIGPGQSSLFVSAAFARQVAEAERGGIKPIIKVGNLEAVRDFTDVEDMVKAYRLAGETALGHTFYNISSGKGVRIQELLDILISLARVKIEVEQDPKRLRPSDLPVLTGNHDRFSEETGWQPKIPIHDSLERILDYWRERSTQP